MNIDEAIERRISCRSYADKQIEPEKMDILQQEMDKINEETGLHFQLYGPRGNDQTAIDTAPSVFSGTVYHYIACVAPNDEIGREMAGYYGEKLVLLATQLGLASCWAMTNYNESTLRVDEQPGEALAAVIMLGYPMLRTPTRQWLIRANFRKNDNEPEKHIESDTNQIPDWFMDGVKCMQIGPSGVNFQPVTFRYQKGVVSAYMPNQRMAIQDPDLGIGKLHFELGSRKRGKWQWGKKGIFEIED